MDSFNKHLLKQEYDKLAKLGDRLAKANQPVDWERFRPIIKAMYRNDTERGGRLNTDEVVMVKLLLIQQWYGLSDIELERQASDRISFQRFLGWPEQPPDYSTVWQFRERLAATRTDELVWRELQRHGKARGDGAKSSQEDDAVGNIHFQLKISVWGDKGVA